MPAVDPAQNAQLLKAMILEQRGYLDQHQVAMSKGLSSQDARKLEQLLLSPQKSVVAGMRQLILTFDSFANKHEQSGLLQFMPFFIGQIEDYSAELKVKVLGRLVQEFVDKAMNFLRANIRTKLWALEENLDHELYEVLTDLFLSDLVNKVAIQAQSQLIEMEKFEALEKCGEESGKAPLRRGVFIIHDLTPREYGQLFEMTVFLGAYFEKNKRAITLLIEKFGFRSTMELLVIYGMGAYQLLGQDNLEIKARFVNFLRICSERIEIKDRLWSDFPLQLIWKNKAQTEMVEQLIFFFCRSPHTDILGLINAILIKTQKNKTPAIVERVKQFCREANFDGLSRELATYIHLAH